MALLQPSVKPLDRRMSNAFRIHYYEHYLFFRLQEMHHNDVLRMETQEIELPEDDEKISNPVYWMEKQADRGAYGLMMPVTFMRGLMAEKRRTLKPYG